MVYETPFITTIVSGLVLAFVFGAILKRLNIPPLVGYVLGGLIVSMIPGFVIDQAVALQLADLGAVLLMFGLGVQLSLRDLRGLRPWTILGSLIQLAVATVMGLGLGLLLGWDVEAGLVFGLALSVASMAVLSATIRERRQIQSEIDDVARGWASVQTGVAVLVLVLMPALSMRAAEGPSQVYDPFVALAERLTGLEIGLLGGLVLTVIKVAAFIGFMLIVGRRLLPWLLQTAARTGSRELCRLAVIAIALGIALGSAELFTVPLALGAFFAGLILAEDKLVQQTAEASLPFREAFAVLFFVALGLLFDPSLILTNPLSLAGTILIIMIGKAAVAFAIASFFRRPATSALSLAWGTAHIGEFSFILVTSAVALAILPVEGRNLIITATAVSIALNPVLIFGLKLFRPRLEARLSEPQIEPLEPSLDASKGVGPRVDNDSDMSPEDALGASSAQGHIILVGFGRIGRLVGPSLVSAGLPLVVIDDSDQAIQRARDMGIETVAGDAADPHVLQRANAGTASHLAVSTANVFEVGQIVEQARRLNANLSITVRAESNEAATYLSAHGANRVLLDEQEIGDGILRWLRDIHGTTGKDQAPADPPEPSGPSAETPTRPSSVATAVLVPIAAEAIAASQPEPVPASSGSGAPAALDTEPPPTFEEHAVELEPGLLPDLEPEPRVPDELLQRTDDASTDAENPSPEAELAPLQFEPVMTTADSEPVDELPPPDPEPVGEAAQLQEEPQEPALLREPRPEPVVSGATTWYQPLLNPEESGSTVPESTEQTVEEPVPSEEKRGREQADAPTDLTIEEVVDEPAVPPVRPESKL